MAYFRYVLLLSLLGSAASIPGLVAARSCLPPGDVRWGFLGLWDGEQGVEAPRNVAVVHNPELLDISSRPRTTVPVVAHSIEGLWRPATPLPPGTPLESIGQTVITTDVIDTEAPSAIEILSISTGGPCGMLKVEAAESPSDDHTPRDRLAFAVYAGATRAEAMESASRKKLLNNSYGYVYPMDLPWVSISVLDQAGNESPRSEAVEVIDASSGCAASGPRRSTPGVALLVFVLCLFAAKRRRAVS